MFLLLLCCGCSVIDPLRSKLEQALWDSSGVAQDEDYIQYQSLAADGQLDPEGTYHSDLVESYMAAAAAEPEGTILVSFARNDYLDVEYYLDAAQEQRIEGGSCFMNPGNVIYASAPSAHHPAGSLYQFSEFRVWTHDSSGKLISLPTEAGEFPGIAYRIPEDFAGTDLSILPLGAYRNRVASLSSGMPGPDGTLIPLSNVYWEVNGRRYGNGSLELKAMETYHLVFNYSHYKNSRYFMASDPLPYWDKASDGTITFLIEPGSEAELSFRVVLHPFGKLTIRNAVSYQNAIDSIIDAAATMFGGKKVIEMKNLILELQVNGVPVENIFDDSEILIDHLKVGDEVLIRIPVEYRLLGAGLALPDPVFAGDACEYRFTVPDTDSMSMTVDVGNRNLESEERFEVITVEHGTFTVYDSLGMAYTAGSELPAADDQVTVEIVPDTNYFIYGKNVKNNVYRVGMKYSDYISRVAQIISDHPIREGIRLTLDTSDDLGSCTFWLGTEMVSGAVILPEGQDLQFDYLLNTDSGYMIVLSPEERVRQVDVWNPYVTSRDLEITAEMNGTTLHCRDFITLEEGVPLNDTENPD